eukprot:CFRG3413T1
MNNFRTQDNYADATDTTLPTNDKDDPNTITNKNHTYGRSESIVDISLLSSDDEEVCTILSSNLESEGFVTPIEENNGRQYITHKKSGGKLYVDKPQNNKAELVLNSNSQDDVDVIVERALRQSESTACLPKRPTPLMRSTSVDVNSPDFSEGGEGSPVPPRKDDHLSAIEKLMEDDVLLENVSETSADGLAMSLGIGNMSMSANMWEETILSESEDDGMFLGRIGSVVLSEVPEKSVILRSRRLSFLQHNNTLLEKNMPKNKTPARGSTGTVNMRSDIEYKEFSEVEDRRHVRRPLSVREQRKDYFGICNSMGSGMDISVCAGECADETVSAKEGASEVDRIGSNEGCPLRKQRTRSPVQPKEASQFQTNVLQHATSTQSTYYVNSTLTSSTDDQEGDTSQRSSSGSSNGNSSKPNKSSLRTDDQEGDTSQRSSSGSSNGNSSKPNKSSLRRNYSTGSYMKVEDAVRVVPSTGSNSDLEVIVSNASAGSLLDAKNVWIESGALIAQNDPLAFNAKTDIVSNLNSEGDNKKAPGRPFKTDLLLGALLEYICDHLGVESPIISRQLSLYVGNKLLELDFNMHPSYMTDELVYLRHSYRMGIETMLTQGMVALSSNGLHSHSLAKWSFPAVSTSTSTPTSATHMGVDVGVSVCAGSAAGHSGSACMCEGVCLCGGKRGLPRSISTQSCSTNTKEGRYFLERPLSPPLALYGVVGQAATSINTNRRIWQSRLQGPGSAVGYLTKAGVQHHISNRSSSPSTGLLSMLSSRYRQDFYELERLGKGAYGSVHKVVNKLDGSLYAVKKIRLNESRPDQLLKALREVKGHARLHGHKNVVRYHSAWMEYDYEGLETGFTQTEHKQKGSAKRVSPNLHGLCKMPYSSFDTKIVHKSKDSKLGTGVALARKYSGKPNISSLLQVQYIPQNLEKNHQHDVGVTADGGKDVNAQKRGMGVGRLSKPMICDPNTTHGNAAHMGRIDATIMGIGRDVGVAQSNKSVTTLRRMELSGIGVNKNRYESRSNFLKINGASNSECEDAHAHVHSGELTDGSTVSADVIELSSDNFAQHDDNHDDLHYNGDDGKEPSNVCLKLTRNRFRSISSCSDYSIGSTKDLEMDKDEKGGEMMFTNHRFCIRTGDISLYPNASSTISNNNLDVVRSVAKDKHGSLSVNMTSVGDGRDKLEFENTKGEQIGDANDTTNVNDGGMIEKVGGVDFNKCAYVEENTKIGLALANAYNSDDSYHLSGVGSKIRSCGVYVRGCRIDEKFKAGRRSSDTDYNYGKRSVKDFCDTSSRVYDRTCCNISLHTPCTVALDRVSSRSPLCQDGCSDSHSNESPFFAQVPHPVFVQFPSKTKTSDYAQQMDYRDDSIDRDGGYIKKREYKTGCQRPFDCVHLKSHVDAKQSNWSGTRRASSDSLKFVQLFSEEIHNTPHSRHEQKRETMSRRESESVAAVSSCRHVGTGTDSSSTCYSGSSTSISSTSECDNSGTARMDRTCKDCHFRMQTGYTSCGTMNGKHAIYGQIESNVDDVRNMSPGGFCRSNSECEGEYDSSTSNNDGDGVDAVLPSTKTESEPTVDISEDSIVFGFTDTSNSDTSSHDFQERRGDVIGACGTFDGGWNSTDYTITDTKIDHPVSTALSSDSHDFDSTSDMDDIFGDEDWRERGYEPRQCQQRERRGDEGFGVLMKPRLYLFIQMQICSSTLHDWLMERNSQCKSGKEQDIVDARENSRIFRELVLGVQYIHSHDQIHRDLKPSNVFLTGSQRTVKVGGEEFISIVFSENFYLGLVTNCQETEGNDEVAALSGDSSIQSDYTSGVGTHSYAPAEQLESGKYTEKVDIFSLGMILFELYCPMSSMMERADLMNGVRKEILPERLYKHFPSQAVCIAMLTAKNPMDRPSASSVLRMSAVCAEGDSVSEHLCETLRVQSIAINSQMEIIKTQAEEIDALRREVDRLQALVGQT